MTHQVATGPTVYLQEELSNARSHCRELKDLAAQALNLINESEQRDHFFSVAGDVIYGIPNAITKLEYSLNSAAMMINKIDDEEIKFLIRPEKVDELEKIVEEIKLRIPRRV